MKISTKGRYGLRAIIDLTLHSDDSFVSLATIAKRQNISLNYLEHSFSSLKKAGIIIGLAGSNGGYKLNCDPSKLTVKDILVVLEGDLSVIDNSYRKNESVLRRCIRENVWEKIDESIDDIVSNMTIQDIIGKNETDVPLT